MYKRKIKKGFKLEKEEESCSWGACCGWNFYSYYPNTQKTLTILKEKTTLNGV